MKLTEAIAEMQKNECLERTPSKYTDMGASISAMAKNCEILARGILGEDSVHEDIISFYSQKCDALTINLMYYLLQISTSVAVKRGTKKAVFYQRDKQNKDILRSVLHYTEKVLAKFGDTASGEIRKDLQDKVKALKETVEPTKKQTNGKKNEALSIGANRIYPQIPK